MPELSPRLALATSELYRALASPCGSILECADAPATRNLLYLARSKSGDPNLALLQFRMGLEPGHLWIIKAEEPERRPCE